MQLLVLQGLQAVDAPRIRVAVRHAGRFGYAVVTAGRKVGRKRAHMCNSPTGRLWTVRGGLAWRRACRWDVQTNFGDLCETHLPSTASSGARLHGEPPGSRCPMSADAAK